MIVILLIITRKWDAFFHPQFWAEDGAMFYVEADTLRWYGLNFPYQGYLHVAPRLIAAVGTAVPSVWVPTLYAWASLAVTAGVAYFLQSQRLRVPGRTIAALAIAAIPHSGEVYLAISNLQWITALALFALAIIDDGQTLGLRGLDMMILVIAGLTGPFVLLSLPLFAWRYWRNRNGWSGWLLVTAISCTALQLPSLIAAQTNSPGPAFHFFNALRVLGGRLVVATFLGKTDLGGLGDAGALIGMMGLFIWVVYRNYRSMPGASAVLSAMILVLAAVTYKARIDTWQDLWPQVADRYFYVPRIFMFWLLGFVAVRYRRAGIVPFITACVAAFAINLPRLISTKASDLKWGDYAARIDRGQPTVAPILPQGFDLRHPGRRARR